MVVVTSVTVVVFAALVVVAVVVVAIGVVVEIIVVLLVAVGASVVVVLEGAVDVVLASCGAEVVAVEEDAVPGVVAAAAAVPATATARANNKTSVRLHAAGRLLRRPQTAAHMAGRTDLSRVRFCKQGKDEGTVVFASSVSASLVSRVPLLCIPSMVYALPFRLVASSILAQSSGADADEPISQVDGVYFGVSVHTLE